MIPLNDYGYLQTYYLSEFPYLQPAAENGVGLQLLAEITRDKVNGLQFKGQIDKEKALAFQMLQNITKDHIAAHQFLGFINKEKTLGSQFVGIIDDEHIAALQILQRISRENSYGLQFQVVKEQSKAIQFRSAIYNTTNLRILVDFPSRGVTGTNWTATSTQASSTNGFSVNNLNTDIVEQYWRSASGVTNATITCNTQLAQGVFLDTLAILNHNFSGSATVELQASNDNFTSVLFTTFLNYEANNIYYIAPSLPTNAYQYWRLIISDPGNQDGFLRIGTVVFGSAIIFSSESFVDRVRFGQKQFVDQVYTEGFTNVSNDRGKKKFIGLDFKNLAYKKFNFQSMRSLFDYAGITLKCLYIPTPQQPSRFAVFGKLAEIPAEEHNYKGEDADYVDFSLEVDESL